MVSASEIEAYVYISAHVSTAVTVTLQTPDPVERLLRGHVLSHNDRPASHLCAS